MEQMELIILVFVAQFLLLFLKHLNMRTTANEYVFKTVTLSIFIQGAWLVGSAIGIKAVLDGNWFIVATYLLAGALGTYFNFKVNIHGDSANRNTQNTSLHK